MINASTVQTAPPSTSSSIIDSARPLVVLVRSVSRRLSSSVTSLISARASAMARPPACTSSAIAACAPVLRRSSCGRITWFSQLSRNAASFCRRACWPGLSAVSLVIAAWWLRSVASSARMRCAALASPVSRKPRVELWICTMAVSIWLASCSTCMVCRSQALASDSLVKFV
jgi:hypothetical protein